MNTSKHVPLMRVGSPETMGEPSESWADNIKKQTNVQHLATAKAAGIKTSNDGKNVLYQCQGESCGGRMLNLAGFGAHEKGTRSKSCRYCVGVKAAFTMALRKGHDVVQVITAGQHVPRVGRLTEMFPQFDVSGPLVQPAPMPIHKPIIFDTPDPAGGRSHQEMAKVAGHLVDLGYNEDDILEIATWVGNILRAKARREDGET